jgi:cysteine desulfurase
MRELVGNPASLHAFGQQASAAVESARQTIAASIGAATNEIVFTSGATESNNLAIKGLAGHPRRRGRHIISVTTEHRAVLDPLGRLSREAFEVTNLRPRQQGHPDAGRVDPQQVADAIRGDTLLVSVMLANNEIGIVQPLAEIATICQRAGVLLHSDATQAVGKIPVDVGTLGMDLMSFSAHKLYGPQGIGALYVCRQRSPLKIAAQLDGGGHESGLRSGTLPVALILGFAKAVELAGQECASEAHQVSRLRALLWSSLAAGIPGSRVNGPDWSDRLPGNLNVCLPGVAAQALMLQVPEIAFATGSACSSARPEPSHVLLGLGIVEDDVRSSLRLSLGRFTTESEIGTAAELLVRAHRDLRGL